VSQQSFNSFEPTAVNRTLDTPTCLLAYNLVNLAYAHKIIQESGTVLNVKVPVMSRDIHQIARLHSGRIAFVQSILAFSYDERAP